MEKSPIWKHFTKRETGMVCSVCGMILTSGSGRFLAANLEKHLRTMHAQSEAFASFQREKTEWTTRRPRQSVAHKIALPVERKPRTVITSEEERRDRRRKMCREAQRRHRQRLRMIREGRSLSHPNSRAVSDDGTTHESIGPSNAEKDNPLTPDCIPDLAPAGDGIHVETNGGAASATVDDAHGSETCKNALDPKVCRAEHKSNPSDSTETTCSTNAVVSFNNTISTDLSTLNLRTSLVNGSAYLRGSDCSPFTGNEKESVANSSSTLTTPEGPSFNDHYSVELTLTRWYLSLRVSNQLDYILLFVCRFGTCLILDISLLVPWVMVLELVAKVTRTAWRVAAVFLDIIRMDFREVHATFSKARM
ncbi:hypothetical protein AAVH_17547 [Aphelenchoides avenae]|nr:hypothetical protein AAVH_17547 [Aphelenchus avenae]